VLQRNGYEYLSYNHNTRPMIANRIKLTIGCAVYDDYRVKFTLQAIRLQLMAAGLLDVVEFIIVDNKPGSMASQQLRTWIERAGIRYIPMPENIGTSQPRQRIFDEARGDAVLVIDAHVLLPPEAVVKLIAFYDANPDCRDLLTGPNIASERLDGLTTHYNLGWRNEFFGMWGTAWKSPTGEVVSAVDNKGWATFVLLPGGEPAAIRELSVECKYGEHTKLFREAGFKPLGHDDADDFEIPAMGLGLFSCRREAWVGFNPNFRGFGGAEHYIHAKFRKRGNCTRSLGFLKWWHDFTKTGSNPPAVLHDKLRNTIIGYQELGLPLDDTRRHFVEDRRRVSPSDFDKLIADPLNAPVIVGQASLEDYYDRARNQKSPVQPHVEALRSFAERCEHVTEFSKSKGTLAAFAAALNRDGTRLVSYTTDANPTVEAIAKLAPFVELRKGHTPEAIEPTDLLFISGKNETTKTVLNLVADGAPVSKYIILHDVARHAELARLCDTILHEQPQWYVAGGSNASDGLAILACDPTQRPAKPIVGWLPGYGPGTELKKILADLGIMEKPDCPCRKRANDMDILGVQGCKDNREMIVGWLREGESRWGWKDKLAAAAKAVQSGLAFKLNPFDPFPGLVDEAIRRAESLR
jgi:glycosyltransferase involved in cell wall biosynthesis